MQICEYWKENNYCGSFESDTMADQQSKSHKKAETDVTMGLPGKYNVQFYIYIRNFVFR